jgi:hypothetical protein
MFSRDDSRGAMLRRAGLWALVLCTTCLAVENTLLLSWVAATRPWAVLTAASAAFRTVCALSVPVGLLLVTGIAGWLLPVGGARGARAERRAVANGGRHE